MHGLIAREFFFKVEGIRMQFSSLFLGGGERGIINDDEERVGRELSIYLLLLLLALIGRPWVERKKNKNR